MTSLPEIKCPTCRKVGPWLSGPDGPFCSRRCKLVDLGKWLAEEHAVAEPLRPGHLETYADLPPGDQLDQTDGEQDR